VRDLGNWLSSTGLGTVTLKGRTDLFDPDRLKSLGADAKQVEFAAFLAPLRGDAEFLDYKKIDLMMVPHLVPDIWVMDFRDGIDGGLRFLFSGTRLDKEFGTNLMGKTLEEVFSAHSREEMLDAFRQAYLRKQGLYVSRFDYYELRGKHAVRHIRALSYPCSTDGVEIDYAIGMTTYSEADGSGVTEPAATFLAP